MKSLNGFGQLLLNEGCEIANIIVTTYSRIKKTA